MADTLEVPDVYPSNPHECLLGFPLRADESGTPLRNRNAFVTPNVSIRNEVRIAAMAATRHQRQLLRKCPSCDELAWMDARAIYCSPACKQVAYRLRKKHQVKRQRCILCRVRNAVGQDETGAGLPELEGACTDSR